jgi:predicted AlkP superfamily pyrophosphatase or phosphodiesterase
MARALRSIALAITVVFLLGSAAGAAPQAKPRLVVLISIDQFRADYQTRFEDLYLPAATRTGPGGFRYLMEKGAYHTDAHHDHFPLYTGPGHSIHLTGAPPYKSGIISNDWFDRDMNSERYCVRDPKNPLVGADDPDGKLGVSPATLRVTTVGDELKMATGGQAKVWGLAFKDRAAVLMAGHLADGVLWFNDKAGDWITSRYYRKDGTLPKWVADWNGKKKIDARIAELGQRWKPLLSGTQLAEAQKRLWTPRNENASDPSGLGKTFGTEGHAITNYKAFTTTPFGNEYVLATARELIAREGLGKDSIPDILALNFSSNDYIGHAYGPDSAEVLDAAVRTDRQLSEFFQFLDKNIPGGLASITIVLTADHGVAPIAAETLAAGVPAGTFMDQTLQSEAEKALEAGLGSPNDESKPDEKKSWTKAMVEDNFYLDLDILQAKGIPVEPAEEIAAAALRGQPGIYAAYTRTQILEGRMLDNDIARRVARSFHPKVSGNVVIVPEPYWMPGYGTGTGTTHGSPYAYDTSVPLLLSGFGVRPGRYTQRVSTLDIAPTLSDILGVLQPSGCEGHILSQARK